MRTRFAPSPTGFLHLGSARTALFNYCLAKHKGGAFLLRIEDTDHQRSTEAAKEAILDGLTWLGLTPDEPTVYQSTRAPRHVEIAHQLLAQGRAYRCYATPEELEIMREEAKATGRPVPYDRRWRNVPEKDHPTDRPFVIRLKVPLRGEMILFDHVQGALSLRYDHLDDMVLLRADGTPTYMLAVVVDDHDMGITHIMRGDDHLNNAFRQRALFDALDWPIPELYHIPLIHGPDGAKLSKRHGAVAIQAYRDQGILPEAMINALLRLGWGHGDQEIFSLNDGIAHFSGYHLGRAPSRFDPQKLLSLNAHYLRTVDMMDRVAPLLAPQYPDATPRHWDWLRQMLPHLTQRAERLGDVLALCPPYMGRPEKGQAWTPAFAAMADQIAPFLASLPPHQWTEEGLSHALKGWATDQGKKLADVAMPLRMAMTGSTASPSVFAILAILGRDEVLARLQ
ncbi:MAG: glutamate--tRNA ligase [Alphaproteobacteria bacterium]